MASPKLVEHQRLEAHKSFRTRTPRRRHKVNEWRWPFAEEILSSTVWTLCYLLVVCFPLYHFCFGFCVILIWMKPHRHRYWDNVFFWDKLRTVDHIGTILYLGSMGRVVHRAKETRWLWHSFGREAKIITRRQKCWCHIKYWYWIARCVVVEAAINEARAANMLSDRRMWSDINSWWCWMVGKWWPSRWWMCHFIFIYYESVSVGVSAVGAL